MLRKIAAQSVLILLAACGGESDTFDGVQVQCTTIGQNTSTTSCIRQPVDGNTTAGTPAGTDRIISRLE